MGLRNIMALQKKTRGVVRLYQGISEIVADIWRPTVKDGLGGPDTISRLSHPVTQAATISCPFQVSHRLAPILHLTHYYYLPFFRYLLNSSE
jgi:hypothetical protein